LTGFVLILLVVAAFAHAGWNAISKQVLEKDVFFTLITGVAIVLYFPIACYLFLQHSIPPKAIVYMLGSTACELIYFYGLARAYQALPFSYAYPIVRGLGPLVSTILSFLLGISLTAWGIVGILIVVVGILMMQFRGRFILQTGAGWAFIAGSINGCALTFDSMGAVMMSGILFKYVVFIGIFIGKIIMDKKPFPVYYKAFCSYPGKAVIGGLFTFGANAATQYALQSTAVGYVSATRELSIAFGVLIGWLFFKEEIQKNQYIGILLLIIGIFLIKIGG
jgi:drug/metabolite transporter (DMT)-like permease